MSSNIHTVLQLAFSNISLELTLYQFKKLFLGHVYAGACVCQPLVIHTISCLCIVIIFGLVLDVDDIRQQQQVITDTDLKGMKNSVSREDGESNDSKC